MKQASATHSRNKVNLAVDIAIFAAFLVAMAPHFSGMAVHEWLGIAFGAAVVTHLLLHWQWLVEVTSRFFGQIRWPARLNYLFNALLFVAMTLIIFSGLMISESALPLLGLTLGEGGAWKMVHKLASDGALLLTGLHVALHWRWIVSATTRFVIAPLTQRRAPRTALTPANATREVQP
jgi:hypothetical protein